jgi:hypothetical protein
MSQLEISAGEHTEELLKFILDELGDEHIDEVDVKREIRRGDPLAGEAITTAVLLTLGPMLIIATTRIIEKWLENRRQEQGMETTIKAYGLSKDAGAAVHELAITHANVTVQALPELKAPE